MIKNSKLFIKKMELSIWFFSLGLLFHLSGTTEVLKKTLTEEEFVKVGLTAVPFYIPVLITLIIVMRYWFMFEKDDSEMKKMKKEIESKEETR